MEELYRRAPSDEIANFCKLLSQHIQKKEKKDNSAQLNQLKISKKISNEERLQGLQAMKEKASSEGFKNYLEQQISKVGRALDKENPSQTAMPTRPRISFIECSCSDHKVKVGDRKYVNMCHTYQSQSGEEECDWFADRFTLRPLNGGPKKVMLIASQLIKG